MHDLTPFVPPARAVCAAVVAATKTVIAIRKRRYRSVETPTGSGKQQTAPAQPILTAVSGIAQAAGAIMTILWWLHQAGAV